MCVKTVDYEFYNTDGSTAELCGRTAKTANTPASFLVWKTRFKTQVSNGSDFPSEAMLWIKKVEMVDSLDELESSRSVIGKDFPNFEEDCLGSEQDHPEFPVQEEGQPRGTESPERGPVLARKTDRLHDPRLLSSHWCS